MNAAVLLEKLSGVYKAGNGWRADCPNGHTKAHGSLAITEADDGRVLIHCFACCDTPGILSAVGLELTDLFLERIKDPSPEARQRAREAFKRNSWIAALRVLSREAMVVCCAAETLHQGHALNAEDDARLTLAIQRFDNARGVLT